MKDYLTIVRKIDFIDLFKYGHFKVSKVTPFNGNLEDYIGNNKLFNEVTMNMNPFEYSFEYLMLHFESEEAYSSNIDIENVKKVYTFNEEAKRELSISFDSRIELTVSPWTKEFSELHNNIFINQSLRGVNNLWTIFSLSDKELERCKRIITEKTINKVFRSFFANERPSGEISIWSYLMLYERHSLYPNDMRGFFCDLIHVYCNFLERKEIQGDVAEGTELYKSIMICEPKMAALVKVVEKSPFNEKVNKVANCRFSVAAPLFLYLKSSYKEGIPSQIDQKKVSYIKEFGGFEGAIAVYLLGITLGHDKTYDAFYENANLHFFKKQTPIVSEKEETSGKRSTRDKAPVNNSGNIDEEPDKKKQNSEPIQDTLFPLDPIPPKNQRAVPIKWVRKSVPNAPNDVLPIYNSELGKIPRGYKEIKTFTEKDRFGVEKLGYNFEEEKERLRQLRKSK